VFFRGRAGKSRNLRRHYLFLVGSGSVTVDGVRFVSYEEYRGGHAVQEAGPSKVELVRGLLESNRDRAFYSVEVREALAGKGVRPPDVMASARQLERKGLVYVRGYQCNGRMTPFERDYLLTWVDQTKPRDTALREPVDRTTSALEGSPATHPTVHRVHVIRDLVIASSHLRELVGFEHVVEKLGCSEYEAENAIRRALQLYPDLKEERLFGLFRFYYHTSMTQEDLEAAKELRKNYLRTTKGTQNRIGHNWEAAVEWFIDTFTRGAEFQNKEHRVRGMDPRRITLHLLKPVGDRRRNAEVDRVWTVTPGIFAQPITYVLECKWGLVSKRDLDDFLEVLRWSTELGADTSNGRTVKNGVIGVFAASAFDPKATIYLGEEALSLPTYAARLNLQLIHPSDLNKQLHERVSDMEITVQRICRITKDENEVRETLTEIWRNPKQARKLLEQLTERNKGLYELEKTMEETNPNMRE
jgi:hypothetical protein